MHEELYLQPCSFTRCFPGRYGSRRNVRVVCFLSSNIWLTYFPSGINRLTKNFDLALPIIDDAFRTTDKEAVAMSRYLVLNDGLFLGSSSACNLVACIRLAKKMGWKDGQVIVTVLYVSLFIVQPNEWS